MKIPSDMKNKKISSIECKGSVTNPSLSMSFNNINNSNSNISPDKQKSLNSLNNSNFQQIIIDELEQSHKQPTNENILDILHNYCSSANNTKGSLINLLNPKSQAPSQSQESYFNFDEKRFNEFLEHKRKRPEEKVTGNGFTPYSTLSPDLYSALKYSSPMCNTNSNAYNNLLFFNNNFNNFVSPTPNTNIFGNSKSSSKRTSKMSYQSDKFAFNTDMMDDNNPLTHNSNVSNATPGFNEGRQVKILSPTAKKIEMTVPVEKEKDKELKLNLISIGEVDNDNSTNEIKLENDNNDNNCNNDNNMNDIKYDNNNSFNNNDNNNNFPNSFYAFQMPNLISFNNNSSITPPPFWNLNFPELQGVNFHVDSPEKKKSCPSSGGSNGQRIEVKQVINDDKNINNL